MATEVMEVTDMVVMDTEATDMEVSQTKSH
jgi:hypothetical protein